MEVNVNVPSLIPTSSGVAKLGHTGAHALVTRARLCLRPGAGVPENYCHQMYFFSITNQAGSSQNINSQNVNSQNVNSQNVNSQECQFPKCQLLKFHILAKQNTLLEHNLSDYTINGKVLINIKLTFMHM